MNQTNRRVVIVYESIVMLFLVLLAVSPFVPSTAPADFPAMSLFFMKWRRSIGVEFQVSRLALFIPVILSLAVALLYFPFRNRMTLMPSSSHGKKIVQTIRFYVATCFAAIMGLWNGICMTCFFSFLEGWYLLVSLIVGLLIVFFLLGGSHRRSLVSLSICVFAYEFGVCLRFILWPDYSKLVWGSFAGVALLGVLFSVLMGRETSETLETLGSECQAKGSDDF